MYNEYFVPFPLIETERLRIRMVRKSDAEDLYELCRRPETSRFSLWSPHEDLNETKDFIAYQISLYRKRKCMFFIVEEKLSGRVIGTCSYVSMDSDYKIAEIGYSILSDLWNKGFGTEVAEAITGYAFDRIGVQRVFAMVLPQNTASSRVLLKLGFELEGVAKKGFYYKGHIDDVLIYGITDDVYFESRGKNG